MQTYIGIKTSFIQITNNIVTNVSKNDSKNVDFSGIEAVFAAGERILMKTIRIIS